MNPITQTKNQNAINERELRLGYTGTESSWHRQYKDSAWIFVGGLNYELTEGDVICVFSQYGEIANINLVRDKDTGRSKGFAFVCYENQKSTVLATDNLNGIKLAGRIIRVDHVEKYKVPAVGVVKVGRQDATQVPAGASDPEFSSVTDYVREHGCGPEAMRRILQIQKANKSSQGSSQSNGVRVDGPPSPPRGSRRQYSQNHVSHSGGRSPSVSPPRHKTDPSPPREKRPRRHSPTHRRFVHSPKPEDISPMRRRSEGSPRNASPPRHRNKLPNYSSFYHSRRQHDRLRSSSPSRS